MSLTPGSLDTLIDRARQLVEPIDGLADRLREHLDATGAIHAFTHTTAPPLTMPIACVDGAVADEQTDALVWATAVGVAQTTGRDDHATSATAVVPVSGDTERLRSALMATCELSAAVAWPDRTVFMDGGLATPLISVAQGVTVTDPDVGQSLANHYRSRNVIETVDAYLDRLLEGHIAALPKQDTATGYIDLLRGALRSSLPAAQISALARMRDRPLVSSILRPGEMLRPRPATELARTEAKPNGGNPVAAALAKSYERLHDANTVHVTYFKPTRLPSRVIKVEYLERDLERFTTAHTLVAALDEQTLGPRMKEPLMQHQVDQAAKRLVTSNLSTITATAARLLDNASATSHYRT